MISHDQLCDEVTVPLLQSETRRSEEVECCDNPGTPVTTIRLPTATGTDPVVSIAGVLNSKESDIARRELSQEIPGICAQGIGWQCLGGRNSESNEHQKTWKFAEYSVQDVGNLGIS